MNWQRRGHGYVSDDGVYAIRAAYDNGYFAWRARVIATDVLVASSSDRGFVERCCERHAAKAMQEATA